MESGAIGAHQILFTGAHFSGYPPYQARLNADSCAIDDTLTVSVARTCCFDDTLTASVACTWLIDNLLTVCPNVTLC